MDKDRIIRSEELTTMGISLFPLLDEKIPGNYIHETSNSLKTVQEVEVLWPTSYVAGRVTQINNLGKIIFIFVKRDDRLWQICVTKEPVTDMKTFEQKELHPLAKKLQVGDIISASGYAFRTNQDKLCVWAQDLKLLTKSFIDPGKVLTENKVKDTEKLRRQRYLELLQSDCSVIKKRSEIIHILRQFFMANVFTEVETRSLLPINSGANAAPFTTKYNALGEDFYLRVAPELDLKRLLVGGMDRIFEIGKNFRNEGMSKRHNPEFTSLEAYAAYMNCSQFISLFVVLLCRLCQWEPAQVKIRTMKKLVEEVAGEVPYEKLNEVFEEKVAPFLTEPTIVKEHPIYCSPLAKAKDELYADRFEFYWKGMEIANGFSEENDPREQRKKFLSQAAKKEEQMGFDEDFLTALEYGMPPAAGLGIGIDRLVMCLLEKDDINDVITFPHYARK